MQDAPKSCLIIIMSNQKAQTALGFDFGLRYIGVAVGQTLTASASPLTVVLAKAGTPNWDDIATLIKHWRPAVLIVGLPLNMDGSNNPIAQHTRKFAQCLETRFQLPVHMTDERLSTRAAYELLPEKKRRKGKQRQLLDSLAAQVILTQWLQSQQQSASPNDDEL